MTAPSAWRTRARVIEEQPAPSAWASAVSRGPAAGSRAATARPPNFVSHTTPLTVAAELGAVGLALYAWLLVGRRAVIAAVRRPRRGARPRAGAPRSWPVRARALLQRLPRGPDHVAGARGRRGLAHAGPDARPAPTRRADRRRVGREAAHGVSSQAGPTGERLGRARGCWRCWRCCSALVAMTLPELGSDPWRFRPGSVDPRGRWPRWCGRPARSGTWASRGPRPSWPRSCAARPRSRSCAAAPGRAGPASRSCSRWRCCSPAPSTLLQLGLRDSTAPWFFTNDSTYQIELGGDLLLDRENPYGHDYRRVGPRALLHPRRQRLRAGARARGGARALRLLPGRVAQRRRAWRLLPGAVRRLPPAGAAVHPRRCSPRRSPSGRRSRWRLALGARAGVQPDRRALGLVRPERRAQPAAARARLRARHPAPLRLGRGGLAGAVLLKQFALVARPVPGAA